eukprot:15172583-Alexandrium_andersonii.AAC.1
MLAYGITVSDGLVRSLAGARDIVTVTMQRHTRDAVPHAPVALPAPRAPQLHRQLHVPTYRPGEAR